MLNTPKAFCQPENISGEYKMQWFADAKLGIFIHAGIYSVNGITESWHFHNGHISHSDYMKQLDGFTLANYDPAEWADLIKETGARYAVITLKHHDGVAMYDTRMNALSSVKSTPAAKDMITPFFEELRKRDMKAGAYYSLIDWTHPDYPGFLKDSSKYRIEEEPEKWGRFMQFMNGQITEILHQFNPDLWWFDGDWEHSAERWQAARIRGKILEHNPNAIINGRLQGFGDYGTPEQNIPVTRPKYNNWELCMTINDNWGYFVGDDNWKTPYEIISIFADVISRGGNMLLDFGPRADGTIQDEKIHVLRELGKWANKHENAIFGTLAGLPEGHFYGPSTISKDSTDIYLFLSGNPRDPVVVRGLFDNIESISVAGIGTPVNWKIVGKISWSQVPGLVFIEVPENDTDKYMSVLHVKLKSPLRLYRGSGGLGL
jgi:alpha-L-fucosidase